MFKNCTYIFIISILLSACAKEKDSQYLNSNDSSQIKEANNIKPMNSDSAVPAAPETKLMPGLSATVTTPSYQKQWIVFSPKLTRNVPSKTVDLVDFKRTIEKTKLVLNLKFDQNALAKGVTTVKLLSNGNTIDSETINSDGQSEVTMKLKFKTPALTKQDRLYGYTLATYDLVTTTGGENFHYGFIIQIYDQVHPTFIAPRNTECTIYHDPEKASGCLQNRTRSVTEISMSNEMSTGQDVSVEFSGGVDLSVSVVALSFGYTKGFTKSNSETHSASYTFNSCIECSYMIYRQVVESVLTGDVYFVLADGSLEWVGTTTFHSKQFSYENVSTGSDSKNFSCDLKSSLPVGATQSCGGVFSKPLNN